MYNGLVDRQTAASSWRRGRGILVCIRRLMVTQITLCIDTRAKNESFYNTVSAPDIVAIFIFLTFFLTDMDQLSSHQMWPPSSILLHPRCSCRRGLLAVKGLEEGRHLVHGEADEGRDELDGVSVLAREEHKQNHHPEARLPHAGTCGCLCCRNNAL